MKVLEINARPNALAGLGASPMPLDVLVENAYRTQLGRPSDPGGKSYWVGQATKWRAQGMSDAQIMSTLLQKFDTSGEYLKDHPAGAAPLVKSLAPLPVPGAGGGGGLPMPLLIGGGVLMAGGTLVLLLKAKRRRRAAVATAH